ncbi:hypothetical protein K438DRAFT_1953822 [Mycena galopus ATCC 62051]|nr:hypothetical protein K438DRAFT_1953822 [Mycena galopus ATCC 62051]
MDSMCVDLPLDIVDLVMGELDSAHFIDRQTVGFCGLVCAEWARTSRSHLFREVHLSDSNVESFIDLAKSSPYPVLSFVHLLVLSESAVTNGTLDQNIKELGYLPNASALRTDIPCPIFVRNSPNLSRICPNLSRLTFSTHHMSLSLQHIFEVAGTFPSLTWIGFRHCDFQHAPPLMNPSNPAQWKRYAWDLDLDRYYMQKFCKHVLTLDPLPRVSSLRLSGMLPEPDSDAGKYLRKAGAGLLYLKFDAHPGFKDDVLRFCTSLRDLVIRFYDISAKMLLFHILPHLHSPKLTTLTFLELSAFPIEPLVHWHEVDCMLADEDIFSSLRTVTIVSRPLFAQRLLFLMPRSVARGILHVTDAG